MKACLPKLLFLPFLNYLTHILEISGTFLSVKKQPFADVLWQGGYKNITKFTGKHPCRSLLFNEVAGLWPATLLKNRLRHRYFSMIFTKYSRTPNLQTAFSVRCFLKSGDDTFIFLCTCIHKIFFITFFAIKLCTEDLSWWTFNGFFKYTSSEKFPFLRLLLHLITIGLTR